MRGTVTRVSPGGDYGFIKADGSNESFFLHVSQLRAAGLDTILQQDDRFDFDVIKGRGAGQLQAGNLRPVK